METINFERGGVVPTRKYKKTVRLYIDFDYVHNLFITFYFIQQNTEFGAQNVEEEKSKQKQNKRDKIKKSKNENAGKANKDVNSANPLTLNVSCTQIGTNSNF